MNHIDGLQNQALAVNNAVTVSIARSELAPPSIALIVFCRAVIKGVVEVNDEVQLKSNSSTYLLEPLSLDSSINSSPFDPPSIFEELPTNDTWCCICYFLGLYSNFVILFEHSFFERPPCFLDMFLCFSLV